MIYRKLADLLHLDDERFEFERITGVITEAMKAAAQEIKAPNVRVS